MGLRKGDLCVLALVALLVASTAAAASWMRSTDSPVHRANELLLQMSLEEKIVLLHGPPTGPCCECDADPLCNYTGNVAPNARLGIPMIKMNDGPQGFRDNQHPGTTTAFPSALTVAASWDTKAMYEWGLAMAQEFFGKGANVQLGPGMNLARVPQNGRNFEYLSGEDPQLGYTLVQPVVQAIQSQGVLANAKHYVLNNQETNRDSVSDDADERTRFEMYYRPFEGAIEAGVASVMCSYNKIYSVWSCENPDTLRRDLKARLGFEGFVMSDWGGTHSTSIGAGLDIEMPSASFMGDALAQSVRNGTTPEELIDDSVRRILTQMFAFGLFDLPNNNVRSANVTSAEHNDVARRLSAAATVLLKNDGRLLPLDASNSSLKIAVIGWADQRAFTHGGGSGQVEPARVVTPLQGIVARLGDGARVSFSDGSPAHHEEAATLAAAADVAIVFVGTTSSEGSDRPTLAVDEQGAVLIGAVAARQPRTVVVVSAPGAVLTNWSTLVPTVLFNFMPGQEVGSAIADVLFGTVNPSARLPITLPLGENDQNFTQAQYPGLPAADPAVATYSEGLFFGYRWYDAHNATPAFAFGHGLSYTHFSYSGMKVAPGESSATVTFTVTNDGAVAGREVPQLYLGFPPVANSPPKVLRAFEVLPLTAGESREVSFALSARDLSVWDATAHRWTVVHGQFTVFVGASSRDIRLQDSFVL